MESGGGDEVQGWAGVDSALARRTGLVSFYGPGLTQVARPDTPEMSCSAVEMKPQVYKDPRPAEHFARAASLGSISRPNGCSIAGSGWWP